MDIVQDWAMDLLSDHGYMPPYVRQAYSVLSTAQKYGLAMFDKIATKPDLATIALLLVIILVSLKLLDMLYKTVLFWIRLGRTIVFWGGLAGLALWMYTRGPEGVSEDISYWYNAWNGEYQYWKQQESHAKLFRQKPTYAKAKFY